MEGGAGEQAQQRVGDGPLVQRQRQLRARGAHHPQQPQHRDERAARDQRRLDHQLGANTNIYTSLGQCSSDQTVLDLHEST